MIRSVPKPAQEEKVYTYTPFGCVGSYGFEANLEGSQTAWYATKYDTGGNVEKIHSVSFFTMTPDSDVYVYLVEDGERYVGQGFEGIIEANQTLISGATPHNYPQPGFYTVELPQGVEVQDEFMIAIKVVTTSDAANYTGETGTYAYIMPIEYAYQDYSSNVTNSGKSYVSSNPDSIWYLLESADVCINVTTTAFSVYSTTDFNGTLNENNTITGTLYNTSDSVDADVYMAVYDTADGRLVSLEKQDFDSFFDGQTYTFTLNGVTDPTAKRGRIFFWAEDSLEPFPVLYGPGN